MDMNSLTMYLMDDPVPLYRPHSNLPDAEPTAFLCFCYDPDPDPVASREDSLVQFYLKHSRYDLPQDVELDSVPTHPDALPEALERAVGPLAFYYTVHAIDHSGLHIFVPSLRPDGTAILYTPDYYWDGSYLGAVFLSRAHLRKLTGWKRLTRPRLAQAQAWFEAELAQWLAYFNGESFVWLLLDGSGRPMPDSWHGPYYGTADLPAAWQDIRPYLAEQALALPPDY